jgi:bifunctional oligoribonuclease and PAP phosphatase NrnA
LIDWTPFVEMVRRHQRFVITTHVRPDGDGLGSMLALGETLERQGKKVHLVIASVMPPRYRFLNFGDKIRHFQTVADLKQVDAAVVLDTGTWNQLGDFGPVLRSLTVPKVVIDHHQTQDDMGATQLVDTTAEATGRLVFEAIQALAQPLSERAANALFVALAMDTGWFRHSNATAASFTLAADLVRAGANPEILYEQLFENNLLPRMKLMGLVLNRLQLANQGRVAHTEILRTDYAATGAVPPDTEDLVNFTRSVQGVEVGLLFMEQPRGGVKVSFRARDKVDVARVAEKFGGGGHRRASGATLNLPLEEAKTRVLEALAAELNSCG